LHSEGRNPNEIAAETGRAYSTVASLLRASGGIRPRARKRSTLRLSLGEREEISRGLHAGETFAVIASRVGRSTSTVSREVARDGGRGRYRAVAADRDADHRARRPKAAKLLLSVELRREVEDKLGCHWSPEQIAAWLRRQHPSEPQRWISHEAIYRSIYLQVGLAPGLNRQLRTGRPCRRPRCRSRRERRGQNPNMVLITRRPAHVEDRSEPGHWEGDLVFGQGHRRAIGTLVERSTRYLKLVDLTDGFDAERLCHELLAEFGSLPLQLRRTLTWDQGSEMSAHQTFSAASGIPVFFCQPRSPWQRGTNENTNGLLRQYYPRGLDLRNVNLHQLRRVANEINQRPRRVLGWLTPTQRFDQLMR